MQMRLRDYLGQKFNELKKTKSDVFESPRALAKLMKEAGRLKKVLSANSEHLSQVRVSEFRNLLLRVILILLEICIIISGWRMYVVIICWFIYFKMFPNCFLI